MRIQHLVALGCIVLTMGCTSRAPLAAPPSGTPARSVAPPSTPIISEVAAADAFGSVERLNGQVPVFLNDPVRIEALPLLLRKGEDFVVIAGTQQRTVRVGPGGIAFGPDSTGKRVLIGIPKGTNGQLVSLRWLDQVNGTVGAELPVGPVTYASRAPSGHTWALVINQAVWLWDEDGDPRKLFKPEGEMSIGPLSWSPDGDLLAVTGWNHENKDLLKSSAAWVVHLDGSVQTPKVPSTKVDMLPLGWRSSTRVVWANMSHDEIGVWEFDAQTRETTEVVWDRSSYLASSPDLRFIALRPNWKQLDVIDLLTHRRYRLDVAEPAQATFLMNGQLAVQSSAGAWRLMNTGGVMTVLAETDRPF